MLGAFAISFPSPKQKNLLKTKPCLCGFEAAARLLTQYNDLTTKKTRQRQDADLAATMQPILAVHSDSASLRSAFYGECSAPIPPGNSKPLREKAIRTDNC